MTQDYKEAMALGDRIAVLSTASSPRSRGPRRSIESQRRSSVARLFGDPTINLIPVAPLASPAGLKIGVGGASVSLPPGYGASGGRKPCMLGVRPEAICASRTAASPDSFPVEVVAVTPLNEKTLLLLRTGDGREILASEAGTAEAPRRHGPALRPLRSERGSSLRRARAARRIAPQAA